MSRIYAGDALLVVSVVDLDAQRLEKLQILIADLEFSIRAEGGDQGSLVGGVFALLADADGGFENEENVVAAFLDAGNDFGDRFGIGKRLVDRFSEFFHELLQLLIHESPWNRTPLMGDITSDCDDAQRTLYAWPLLKSTDDRPTDRPAEDRRPSGKENQVNLPCRRQYRRRHGATQPDRPRGTGRHPRDSALFRAGAAPTLAGSDRIHLPGDCRARGAGRHARIREVPVWPRGRTGKAGACRVLHCFVHLVRGELVLASKTKSQKLNHDFTIGFRVGRSRKSSIKLARIFQMATFMKDRRPTTTASGRSI